MIFLSLGYYSQSNEGFSYQGFRKKSVSICGEGDPASIRLATYKGLGKFQRLIRRNLGGEWRL